MIEKMTVPFADLNDGIRPLFDEYTVKIGDLIRGADFIGGSEVEAFEREYAEWTKSSFAIGAANGTDALMVALRALNIGAGDKVLVPVNTFIATSEAVTMVGAEVDFIEVEKDYYTMDPSALEEYLAKDKHPNIKAVIPVHLYGQMADMSLISRIAKKYGLKVIEDSAQAHGSKLNGKHPGYFGDLATYSFYPGKNIGAFGDAGAITTNDEALYRRCKMLVNHGRWKAKYEHEIEGYNMRLDTIQAAVLRIKLRHIDEFTMARKKAVSSYLGLLDGSVAIEIPKVRAAADPVWHILPVRVEDRDGCMQKLKDVGVSTGIHYPIPLHLQPAYAYKGYAKGDFAVAEEIARRQLSLPLWPEIKESQIRYVVAALKNAAAQ